MRTEAHDEVGIAQTVLVLRDEVPPGVYPHDKRSQRLSALLERAEEGIPSLGTATKLLEPARTCRCGPRDSREVSDGEFGEECAPQTGRRGWRRRRGCVGIPGSERGLSAERVPRARRFRPAENGMSASELKCVLRAHSHRVVVSSDECPALFADEVDEERGRARGLRGSVRVVVLVAESCCCCPGEQRSERASSRDEGKVNHLPTQLVLVHSPAHKLEKPVELVKTVRMVDSRVLS